MTSEWAKTYLAKARLSFGFEPPVLNAAAGNAVANRYYEEVYADLEHQNLDCQASIGIDIVADVCSMPQIVDCSYGTVIAMDALEHIEYPSNAMKEFHRILKPNGILVITTVCCYSIHRWSIFADEKPGNPPVAGSHYNDYWRFTPDGIKVLFRDAGLKLLDMRVKASNMDVGNLADLPIGEGADEANIINLGAVSRK